MLSDIDKNQYVYNIFIARYCFIPQKNKRPLGHFPCMGKIEQTFMSSIFISTSVHAY